MYEKRTVKQKGKEKKKKEGSRMNETLKFSILCMWICGIHCKRNLKIAVAANRIKLF